MSRVVFEHPHTEKQVFFLQKDTYRITIILQSLAGCFQVAVIRENNERIMFSKDSN